VRFKRLLVTGGAGFIGSTFIRQGLSLFPSIEIIVNLDILNYAGAYRNMKDFLHSPSHCFVQGDIGNKGLVKTLCEQYDIEAIVHFAGETHVDRSIQDPLPFVKNNIEGTALLLEVIRELPHIHFHHISTDEVYGSLGSGYFNEESPYRPNSPYSASKAAADHLVRAWCYTYGLSVTLSHCTNNYGPFQHEEKFIPYMIQSALRGAPFTLYGSGVNIRNWIYVEDHVEAVWLILDQGSRGEIYDIGGQTEMKNIDLLQLIITFLSDKIAKNREELEEAITFVADRPAHDFRYALDSQKIQKNLGWSERHTLLEGLNKTIDWYLEVWKELSASSLLV